MKSIVMSFTHFENGTQKKLNITLETYFCLLFVIWYTFYCVNYRNLVQVFLVCTAELN